jgi:hypothetical protein
MGVPTESLRTGRCYWTAKAEIVMIVSFDGSRVIYVVERDGVCATWNPAAWRAMSRVDFAQQANREVFRK